MTPLQLQVLDYVRELSDGGISPSVRQIAARIGAKSPSTAQRVIEGLVRDGHLARRPGSTRSLRLADQPDLRRATSDALRAELARRGETTEALRVPEARAYGRRISCAADTCGIAVQRGHLFCRTHWFALPDDLRAGILGAFRARDTARYQQLVGQARDIADGCTGVIS